MNVLMKRYPGRVLTASLALLAGGMLAGPQAAQAAASCSPSGIAGLGVPNVSVISAAPDATNPTQCDVLTSVATSGFDAPPGSAELQLRLPSSTQWNDKLVFFGVGGFAGGLGFSTNANDPVTAATSHYAIAVTDTGHESPLGSTDASWALIAPGVPDEAKLTDYYFRATHETAVAAKELVERFYGSDLRRAYFDGCSNGGRQAFVEATKFPDDFDGIVAGDPFFDIRSILSGVDFNKIQLASSDVYIPATKLPMIDAAVYQSCDAADGVVDHLIQNPEKCSFDPKTLVTPTCTGSTPTCLTAGEANTLTKYLTALRDDDGNIVYTGETVSDLAAGLQGPLDANLGGMDFWTTGVVPPTVSFDATEPWDNNGFFPFSPIGWSFTDHFIKFVVERDPNFDMRSYIHKVGQVSDDELRLFDKRSEVGNGDDPHKLERFIRMGKKMVVYHGFSDPALNTTRTIKYYEDLADTLEMSFSELQEHVRLFTVPGMHHCTGGPGPNFFDTLTALDQWVDGVNGKSVPPDAILALHFPGNNPASLPDRTMPLCKFPEEARWNGQMPVTSAANWSCPPRDRGLLEVGANGRSAGLGGRDRIAGGEGDDD